MGESGLEGPFCQWFGSAGNTKNYRNVTYKERIQMTAHKMMNGTKPDLSKFRPLEF
jgi:hypothetical protein